MQQDIAFQVLSWACLLGFSGLVLTFPNILLFPGISEFSSPPSRSVADLSVALHHHPGTDQLPSPASLAARPHSCLVRPPCLQMGVESRWPC